MNHNNLKRRRPFGPEDDSSVVPAQQSSPPSLQLQPDFFNNAPDIQFQIDQVAAYYHLTGCQLHDIACHHSYLQYTNKRQRSLPDYSMPSQFPGSSLPQDFEEKSQDAGQQQYELPGANPGRSSSGLQASGFPYGLTEGFASLMVCCSNCWQPCAIPQGYQAIAQPIAPEDPVGYGTNNSPYRGEKPPSAQISQQDVYVPTTIPSGETNSFSVGDAGLMGNYVPNYQSLQESPSQGLVAPPSGSDNIVYATEASAPSYYPNVSSASAPDGPHNLSHTASHRVAASDVLPTPYSDNMLDMAVSSALQHQTPVPVTTAGFPIPTQYAMQEMTVKSEDMGPSATTARLDIVYPHQRPPASKRGPFKDQKQREETANTRKMGSCIRCRMQRIRCRTDPDDPNGGCLTCKPKPNNNHHKQLVRQPCLRVKLTEVKCMKPGQVHGHEWTLRWGENGPVDNIANWASSEVKTIEVWEGYTRGMSVQLHVRRFVPQTGDKLERSWVTEDGVKKSVPIPPYAITDLDEAQSAYQAYIRRGVVDCFNTVIEGVMGARDHLLYATYRKAWELSQDARTTPEERELLIQTLELWVAVRLTTKSIEIVGNETLGMNHDILDMSSPQHGRIPLPPVMGAQLDLVLIQHIQTRLRREMLEKLQKMTQQNKPRTWLTTYLVTFILLHNIALLTDHDASYARKHGMKKKFARESDVQEYHNGGTILLAYFHYCNKGVYPFTEECRDQDLRQLAQLDEQALQFVHWTRSQAMAHRHEWEEIQQAKEYHKPYFFVSQLFQRDWQPQTWAY